jgi:hypothetical protein
MAHGLAQRINPKAVAVIVCVFAFNLVFLALLRTNTWGSPLRLSVELAEINPQSSRAAQDLARRFMAMSGGDATSKLYAMSITQLERAARLPSASPLPEEALLIEASTHPGMPTQPWWDSLRRKLETRPLIPDTFMTLHKLATLRLAGNTNIDAQQLANCYAIAVQRAPGRELLHVDYAELAGAALNNPALAIRHWHLALRLDGDVDHYGPQLAGYLVANHRNEEAIAVIAQTLELRPSLHGDTQLSELLERARSAQTAPNGRAPQAAASGQGTTAI